MCKLGATDAQLARAFEVTSVTIWNWRRRHKEFADATKEGKAFFDEQVVRALAQRAVGYSYDQEQLKVVNGVIERRWVRKYIPPDVRACQFWLNNRCPEQWSDRPQITRSPDSSMDEAERARVADEFRRRVEGVIARIKST